IGMLDKHPIADIPGLIEGASKGKGLGITFLKHIEKTKILVHCVALTDKNPQESYDTIRSEFNTFNPVLLTKPEVILLTKTNLVSPEQKELYVKQFSTHNRTVLCCSIYNNEEITAIKKLLRSLVDKIDSI
ncbi:50S ribosome-binding GTPase, partial [Candidatus Gottesmanbacteria bacterium]|nr:50S ribosome-binding GTPase [Candidatus Gottesmanbacteria bacterium]